MPPRTMTLADYARRRATTRSLRRMIRERFQTTARAGDPDGETATRVDQDKIESGAAARDAREAA